VFTKVRRVAVASLVFAALAGYLWVGALLDEILIGLDTSAFPAGAAIQTAAQWVWPDLQFTFAGAFWLAVSLLCIASGSRPAVPHPSQHWRSPSVPA
jgi:hypothetical protein